MSIDDQPMNVYWSGKRTETSNTFKITDKGSVAEYTNLPSSGNQKGDKYEVTADGSDYIWDGSVWSRLGAEKYAYEDIVGMPDFALDANVVHKTGNEDISGTKTFSNGEVKIQKEYKCYINNKMTSYKHNGTNPNYAAEFALNVYDKDGSPFAYLNMQHSAAGNAFAVIVIKPIDTTKDALAVTLRHSASTCAFMPTTTNYINLGASGNLWKDIYASNGTIQTSDERLKSSISDASEELLDAWSDVSWKTFKFKDAVEEKGENARVHSGLVAQQIASVFESHGVDPDRYGFFCYDEWPAEPEERNENGDVLYPAREAGGAYSLRYVEALCIEAAYQRRRADKLEARIAALEALVNGGRQ